MPCGDDVLLLLKSGTALGVCGVSKRRAVCELTAWNSGEREVDEAEVRREAWYDERWLWAPWVAAWKAVEGEGGAERVGEDEVSIAGPRSGSTFWWLSCCRCRSVPACWCKDAPAAVAQDHRIQYSAAVEDRRNGGGGEKSLLPCGHAGAVKENCAADSHPQSLADVRMSGKSQPARSQLHESTTNVSATPSAIGRTPPAAVHLKAHDT